MPNGDFVGIILAQVSAVHWSTQIYSRRKNWECTGVIDLDVLDMYGPPADVPDHVFAEAMKVRLLT